jgi:hypothetical protein
MSTIQSTVCRCSGQTFSSTFYVPFNRIDFNTVWSKFDLANAAVYGSLIIVLVVYVIALGILRREDKRDIVKVCPDDVCANQGICSQKTLRLRLNF